MMRKLSSIMFLFLLASLAPLWAQMSVTTNSADVHDPRLLLANPAGMAVYDRTVFVSGYKLFYVSLGNERIGNFYTGLRYHLFDFGSVGITLQRFHLGTFRQTQVDVNYALSLWKNKLAVGTRVGLLNLGYATDKMNLIHLNDPLLSGNLSRNAANLGLGLIINPVSRLYLGFSANNLNRPDLSLGDSKDRREVNVNLSAMYRYPLFSPKISLEREEADTYFNLGFETTLQRNHAFLRGSYCAERLTFGAGYDFDICRLDYEYDYYRSDLQQVSDGSHQVTLSFAFGHPDTIKPDFRIKIMPLDSIAGIASGICSGQEASYQIDVLPIHGFSKRVKLSLENLPPDLSYQFSASKIRPTERCTLRITPQLQCPPGNYPLIVTGRSCCQKRHDASSIRVRLPLLIPKIYSNPTALTITEQHSIIEERPLLNYVFFDSGMAHIPPDHYALLDAEETSRVNWHYFNRLDSLSERYRQVLNLLGWRLKNNPDFKILLVGCNSDNGSERNNLALSRRRAQNVKDYFVTAWGISLGRIEATERNLPEYRSTRNDPLGCHENRRVEIQPQPGSEPILAADTTTTIAVALSDPLCVFNAEGTIAEAGVNDWQLVVTGNDGSVLYQVNGDSIPPPSHQWSWGDSARQALSFRDSLTVSLSITDKQGQHGTASSLPIRIQRMRKDTATERTRLLFFAFDSFRVDLSSPRLENEFEKIVDKFHRHPQAKVEVKGFTDIIGDSLFNLRLSILRAEAVKKELVRRGIPAAKISAQGFGSQFPIMTNDRPEGRMLNRRVEVDVIYPR